MHLPTAPLPMLRFPQRLDPVTVHCVIAGCKSKAGGQTAAEAWERIAVHYAMDHPEFGQSKETKQ